MSIGGLDCYVIQPRTMIELRALVDTLKNDTLGTAVDAVVGTRSPFPGHCNGVTLPAVLAAKIYSFDIADFIKQIPGIEGQESAARDFLDRLPRALLDNVGEADEHRALNYLALRYQAIYNLIGTRLRANQSLTGINVAPTAGARNRSVVDAVFAFTDRATDITEKFMARIDVTGMFPFLVSGLQPMFDIQRP